MKTGKVILVGKSIKIPKGAKVIDFSGKTMYPSFIDLYSDFGIEKPKRTPNRSRNTQYEASREGYYWNDHIRPDINPTKEFSFDTKKAKELLNAGFGVVNTHMQDGIIRGNGLLIALNPNSSNAYRNIKHKICPIFIFFKE